MTLLDWPPFSRENVRLAVFTSLFLILLGAGLGIVVGSDHGASQAAEAHYGRSVVNTTYTAVAQQVQQQTISPWVALALFIGVILVNNLATTAIAAYTHRFFVMPLAVGVTSYLLVSTGFIPALIGVGFAQKYGVLATLAAMAPNGVIEIAAMALAGALGLLAATAPPSDDLRARVKTVYWRRVAPLIAVAAVVECIVTPILMYIVMR